MNTAKIITFEVLQKEINEELVNHIIPFWLNLRDDEFGGYYGGVDYDLTVHKDAPKGGIAIARILWSFSSAYRILGDESYLDGANHVYEFFMDKVIDSEYGGVLWMLDHKGEIIDDRKHVYAQAFGIYGLTEYYRITGNEKALDMAKTLFDWIETTGFNIKNKVYKEEFTRDFKETDNEMLSENGIVAEATTNTQLHVLEAYTNLYRVWPDAAVENALINLLDIFIHRIYKRDDHFLKVFYDKEYNELLDLQSYGHDIEASWLIDEALEALGIDDEKYKSVVVAIAENIKATAMHEDGSLIIECEDGATSTDRVWWAQAEAMVGYMNAYEETEDVSYLELIDKLWQFTKDHIIDNRAGGEWYWYIEEDLTPAKEPICEPWKTPYHNTRFCLEMIKRINYLTKPSL